MRMSDIDEPKCMLHKSEAERLLSWLRCYPVEGREDERRSLETLLKMALQLAPLDSLAGDGGSYEEYQHIKKQWANRG